MGGDLIGLICVKPMRCDDRMMYNGRLGWIPDLQAIPTGDEFERKRMRAFWLIVAIAVTLGCFVSVSEAQRGDRGNKNQKEVWRDMKVPPAPVLTAKQALSSFKLPPGFRIEVVASDPLIEDPVAMAWDGDGRIWVVEMRGYMPNVDGKGEDIRNGRISVLEDTDGDGRMDKSTVFLDKLQMPRGVAIVKGGVLVAEPPRLWYCTDSDGDLKCDKKVEVARYGRQGPVEHTENGLMWGLDNWMYNAKSSRRFKFVDGKIVDERTAGRGQWGITQDDYGRLFYNSNSSYLHGDLVPHHYLVRNKSFSARMGIGARIVGPQDVHTIRVNPGINRGYQGHMLKKDGRLARTTAVCGPVIYRGDQFPKSFRGNAFVPEPSGNVIAQFGIKEHGIGLKSTHELTEDAKWGKREFLASTDERFRPVNCYNGPDGCLYVVDMYRGILQHKVYVTTFLRKQILERKLDKPIGLGRIYRVVWTKGTVDHKKPGLIKADSRVLVKHLSHANGWWRDRAQRLLIDRNDKGVVEVLRSVVVNDARNHLGRIHALWTLEGMGGINLGTVLAALDDEHPKVRIAALRTGEGLFKTKYATPLLKRIAKMTDDKDEQVRLQVAFTLGEADGKSEALSAMAALLAKHARDRNVRDAIMTGLNDRSVSFLQALLEDRKWVKEQSGYGDVIKTLAGNVYRANGEAKVGTLLALIASQEKSGVWRQRAMLDGILSSSKKPKTIRFKVKPGAIDLIGLAEDKGVRSRYAKVAKLITWSGDGRKIVNTAPNVKPLTKAQQALFTKGKVFYTATCAACHQAHGKGQAGLAPTLVDSPWSTKSDERLIRIVLHGLMGPIKVDGQVWNLVMPPLKDHPFLNDDEKIAAVLTYVRRAWGNTGDPIDPKQVGAVRKVTGNRVAPWTVKELLKFK